MGSLPKHLDTKNCAVVSCGKPRPYPTPLCAICEKDFLKSEEAKPMREGRDYTIENIENCYSNYVLRRNKEG